MGVARGEEKRKEEEEGLEEKSRLGSKYRPLWIVCKCGEKTAALVVVVVVVAVVVGVTINFFFGLWRLGVSLTLFLRLCLCLCLGLGRGGTLLGFEFDFFLGGRSGSAPLLDYLVQCHKVQGQQSSNGMKSIGRVKKTKQSWKWVARDEESLAF